MILLDFDSPVFNFGGIEAGAWGGILALFAGLAIVALLLIIVSIVLAKKRGDRFVMSTRDITYAAVCLGLSYALSFFGFQMPMGGTVTPASILPVAVFCYYFGYRKGLIVCAVYMMLQLTQKPYIVNAWSMLLDYIIPYFALSLVGTISYNFRNSRAQGSVRFEFMRHWGFFLGMLIYIVVRYASHVLSGVLYWDYSADYGMSTLGYSLAYNSFCLVDMAIAAVAGLFLFSSKAFGRTMIESVSRSQNRTHGGVRPEGNRLDDTDSSAEDH